MLLRERVENAAAAVAEFLIGICSSSSSKNTRRRNSVEILPKTRKT